MAESSSARQDTVTVSVVLMSGNLAWGPQAVEAAATLETLWHAVARKVEVPFYTISLVFDGKLLEPKALLREAGICDGGVLTMLRRSFRECAFSMFDQWWEARPFCSDSITRPQRASAEVLAVKMKAVAAECQREAFSEELTAWLEVLLGDSEGRLWFKDPLHQTIITGRADALCFIQSDNYCDRSEYFLVDLDGNLGEGIGAVWIWQGTGCDKDEATAACGRAALDPVGGYGTLAFWNSQDLMEAVASCRKHTYAADVSSFLYLAPSLTEFFVQWIANGCLPRGDAEAVLLNGCLTTYRGIFEYPEDLQW